MKKTQKTVGRMLTVLLAASLLAGCTKGRESIYPPVITAKDKEMSCERIALEINDAEFVRRSAQQKRGLRAGNILWPFGYPATYMSAQEAISKADERTEYLKEIGRIKGCDRTLYE